jgi:hypothetical protein
MFRVVEDEVAFLVLDRRGEQLHFVAPKHLANLGGIFPFEHRSSLAAKTLCERKPIIENRMPMVNHLSFFERARRPNGRPGRIEKMLSYPLYVRTSPLGVVQISRKTSVQHPIRSDFDRSDLTILAEIENTLCHLLQGVRSEF